MANELIIDLGEDFQPVDLVELGRLRNRRGRRSAVLIAVVIAILAWVGLSTPVRSVLTHVADVAVAPGSIVMVADGRLLVAEIKDGTNQLNAYDLADGKRVWSARLTVLTHSGSLARLGDVAIVSYFGASVSGDMTNAVDIRTGRVLWRSSGLLLDFRPSGLIMEELGSAPTLRRFDPETGASAWSRSIGSGCDWNLADDYVEVCANTSTLRVIDLQTGAVRARPIDIGAVQVNFGDGVPEPPGVVKLAEAAGVVIVGHNSVTGPRIDAFSTYTLRSLWSRSFAPEAALSRCGQVFCLYDDQIAIGIDPQTGADKAFPGYDAIVNPGLSTPQEGAGSVGVNTRFALIPLGYAPDLAGNYPGATALPMVADSEAIVVPDPTRLDTFLAAVDRSRLSMRILDRINGAGVRSCTVMAGYLACELPNYHLRLWRLDI